MISDRRRPSSCCKGCTPVSSRSRTAAIAIGHNRKPPSPIKYDGAHCFGKRYLDQSIYITDENADRSYLSGKLAGENVEFCVDDKTFVLLHRPYKFCFPVSCLKSVSQRDTTVSSQKRPKSVLDTDDPYHVACL